MKGIPWIRPRSLLQAILILFLGLVMNQGSHAVSVESLLPGPPLRIEGWRADPEIGRYDDKTIFDYIDGAGEIYRAYNMRKCLSRRYLGPRGQVIVLDLFEMGSSGDAFGVFTHDRDGEPIDTGQGALYRAGWMRFWKDRFFVSLYADQETPETLDALRELARMTAELIPSSGEGPSLLSLLPPDGLRTGTLRYLHDQTVLNSHYYVSDENILLLSPRTDAVLAEYRRGGEEALLLLIQYPETGAASRALESFLGHYLPEAGPDAMLQMENGKWAAGRSRGRILTLILEADSRHLADRLMREVPDTLSGK